MHQAGPPILRPLAVLVDGQIFLESTATRMKRAGLTFENVRAAARAARVDKDIDWRYALHVLVMVEGTARRIDNRHQAVADTSK